MIIMSEDSTPIAFFAVADRALSPSDKEGKVSETIVEDEAVERAGDKEGDEILLLLGTTWSLRDTRASLEMPREREHPIQM